MYKVSHYVLFVGFCLLAALAATYLSSRCVARSSDVSGRPRHLRLAGGALLAGTGIWTIHISTLLALGIPLPIGAYIGFVLAAICVGAAVIFAASWKSDKRLGAQAQMLARRLEDANEALLKLTLHDPLTTLPNRNMLERSLDRMLLGCQQHGGRFAVYFIDVDGFKAVNEAYGHDVGDAMLVELARRFTGLLDDQDCAARLGGDEFVVAARLSENTCAADFAEQLSRHIAIPLAATDIGVSVTASIGYALYPEHGIDARTLMRNADAAMHHGKRTGRATHTRFKFSMKADVHEQVQLVQDLRGALENDELVLFYQPKFESPGRRAVGAEALLRWRHPTRGMIGPDTFIPLAESSGQIIAIGDWVINEACRQMRAWIDAGHENWTIAVNLSPIQFAYAGLVDCVRRALERNRLQASTLTLEITETTAMRDAAASLKVLRELASLGVCISIDDFGTGYSSLLYLKRLPANELKIDRGFIGQLSPGNEDAAIVEAIIALAQKLGLRVVAEGVETEDQQRFLTRVGCDYLQGYLLGRPLPPREFLAANS